MIERYKTPAMEAIWSRQAKYARWLEVELAICDAHAADGTIPLPDLEVVRSKAQFDLARCDELELQTRHDLAAFVRNLEESVGPAGRWIHFGITSYDVIDTALGMMLRDSCDVLIASASALLEAIRLLAVKHAGTSAIGRTHGVHAEPITFGFKVSGWHAELNRNLARIKGCREDVAVGKVSGAVGIHAHVSPDLERRVCHALGLQPDSFSTQIVNRDRIANLLCVLAVTAAGLERVATELRNLQRTEILEVQESFHAGQTGSSAMPHKRNPWNSETIVGLSRIVRSNAHAMLESVATWHERDLTNSSLERIVLPDTFHLVDFMMRRLETILSNLEVFPATMQRNLRHMGDLVFSEHLMNSLIAGGLSRADAYKISQRSAAKAWDGGDFQQIVRQDPEVRSTLSESQLSEIFSLEHHLRNATCVT